MAAAKRRTLDVTFHKPKAKKGTKKEKKPTVSERITTQIRVALDLINAAPYSASVALGFRTLLSGFEHVIYATSIAKSPEDIYRVAQVRKVAMEAGMKLIERCT